MDGSTNADMNKPVSGELNLGNNFYMRRWGKVVQISGFDFTSTGTVSTLASNLPLCLTYVVAPIVDNNFAFVGTAWITTGGRELKVACPASGQKYMTIVYLTSEDYIA